MHDLTLKFQREYRRYVTFLSMYSRVDMTIKFSDYLARKLHFIKIRTKHDFASFVLKFYNDFLYLMIEILWIPISRFHLLLISCK